MKLSMEALNRDIILYILNNFLSNLDKISFIRCKKTWYQHFHDLLIFHGILDDKKDLSKITYPKNNFKSIYLSNISSLITFTALETIIFDDNFNQNIKGMLPKTLKKIIFGVRFDQDLDGVIPDSVKYLSFGEEYNRPIKNVIPKSIKHICFNQESIDLHDEIPTSIIGLEIAWDRNISIDQFSNLVHLVLPSDFNESITHLPHSLKYLKFGDHFNQNIDNILPPKLKYLIFGDDFNQRIDVPLPVSLESLEFGYMFNQKIDYILPCRLKYLKFGYMFDQKIDHILPCQLKYLEFGHGFDRSIDTPMPNSIVSIKFGYFFNSEIAVMLSSSLKELIFGKSFNQPVRGILPENLEVIKFGDDFNQDIEGCFPKNLKIIHFGKDFKKPIKKNININGNAFKIIRFLPDLLTELVLLSQDKSYIFDAIPPNVTRLTMKYLPEHTIIPSSVVYLNIHTIEHRLGTIEKIDSNGMIYYRVTKILPNSIRELKLHDHHHPIHQEYLPNSLEKLYLSENMIAAVFFDNPNIKIIPFSKYADISAL